MILSARRLDARWPQPQDQVDELYQGPGTAAQAKLADARFAAYGDTLYPDATFTLRISYGKVVGWIERGRPVPQVTLLGGTYDRATGADPFDLPSKFVTARSKIDPNTVYHFVTTNDIIGGKSGSPVIAKSGRGIGAGFAGNIVSLAGNYGYDGSNNRTVVVSTDAIEEALEKIYPAPALVAELRGQ